MDPERRPGRRRRGLALGLAALGVIVLLAALWGALRLTISTRAPGTTAGGAATRADLCSRSVPADLAQACRDADRQQAAAARHPLELAAAFGLSLFIVAIGVGVAARRALKNPGRET